MILFTLSGYETMGTALDALPPRPGAGQFQSGRFQNGELHITLHTAVAGEHCVLLGSIAPPDEQLLTLLLLAHTLKKEGARQVTALLPYLAYSRQDKDKPGQSLATAWTGAALKSAGVDQAVTVDVHSRHAQQLYPIPLASLSPASLFAQLLQDWQLIPATLVAPDEGAIPRCREIALVAGLPAAEIPFFEKHRTEAEIRHTRLTGHVGAQAVIIDDILDTGATLLSACEKLMEAGVRDIFILVTHGLFTGPRWQELWQLGVRRIACTDTVPLPAALDTTGIQIVSVLPLLQQQLVVLAGGRN